jgi:Secretion system C-terminal sorting domain
MKTALILGIIAFGLFSQRSIMHRSADRILRSELYDTETLDWTKIRTWLDNKDSKESEYAIVESWMLEGNAATAEQVFDAIPTSYNLTGDALTQHNDYGDWLDLQIGYITQHKDVYDLSPIEVLAIQDIADNAISIAAAQTQGLLNHAYGYNYYLKPVPPSGQQLVGPPIVDVSSSSSVLAFPNPAKESVQFNYNLPKGMEEAQVSVYDLNGSLVIQLGLLGASGTVAWDTNGQSAGIYYYIASMNGLDEAPRKLVLIK